MPAGPFLYRIEGTVRHLGAFGIAKTPVTNAQCARFVQVSGYEAPRLWIEGLSDLKADHPVVCVSWFDAKIYCRWISHRLQVELGLPSQEE